MRIDVTHTKGDHTRYFWTNTCTMKKEITLVHPIIPIAIRPFIPNCIPLRTCKHPCTSCKEVATKYQCYSEDKKEGILLSRMKES